MRIRGLFLLLGAFSILCCGGGKDHPPVSQAPLVILLSLEPTNLDPQVPFDDSDFVLGNIYETLVRFDSTFRLSPGLAQRWTNPDDRTWRFYLDERAKFSDGSPLRAADVKFSIERLQRLSGSDRRGFTEHISSVEVVEERTVDIKTDSPLIILNNLVYIPILSEKNVQAAKQPPFLGTGPYRLKTWLKKDRIILERNTFYYRQPPIAEVHFLFFTSQEKVLDDVVRVKPDLTQGLPFRKIDDFTKLKNENKAPSLQIQSHHGISVYYLVFNLRESVPDFPGKNPLMDIRLRKALALGTNKNDMVQRVLYGYGRAAAQVIAPEILGFDASVAAPEYDPVKAKQLVKEAGYSGLKIPVYVSTSSSANSEKALIHYWADIGIQGELRVLSNEEFARRLSGGTLSLALSGYVCGSGDASEILTFCLHSRDPELKYGKGNYAAYSNKEVDRICEENLRLFDPRQRLHMLQNSLGIVSDELPYMPLLVLDDIYVVSDRLKWEPAVNGEIVCADMSFK